MKKTFTRSAAVLSVLLALLALAGCLKFENSLDLSKPLNPASHTNEPPATGADTPSQQTTAEQASDDATLPTQEMPDTTEANEPGTAAPADESTTAAAPGESTTAAQSLAQYVKSLGTTDYDVLRSNDCYIKADLISGNEITPTDLAIGQDKVYILSDMDGMNIGLYVEGKKTYIYLPDNKAYLKLSNTVAKLIGMDPNEFTSMVSDMGFDSMPPLSEAVGMQDGAYNGTACKVFTLINDEETVRVYMNGKRLLAIDYLGENGGVASTMRFYSVTAGFPAMPPSGYKEIGYMDFAKIVMDGME